MPLSPEESSLRVGINPTLIGQTGSIHEADACIGLLILWRYAEIMTRDMRIKWDVYVSRRASGKGVQPLFWRELWHKKSGLYSGNDMLDCDPMALVRHPWTLKQGEFASALASIEDGNLPSQTDERGHIAANLSSAGGILGASAGLMLLNPVTAAVAPFVGVGAGAIAATGEAITFGRRVVDDAQSSRIKAQIRQYQDMYKREETYRAREVGS